MNKLIVTLIPFLFSCTTLKNAFTEKHYIPISKNKNVKIKFPQNSKVVALYNSSMCEEYYSPSILRAIEKVPKLELIKTQGFRDSIQNRINGNQITLPKNADYILSVSCDDEIVPLRTTPVRRELVIRMTLKVDLTKTNSGSVLISKRMTKASDITFTNYSLAAANIRDARNSIALRDEISWRLLSPIIPKSYPVSMVNITPRSNSILLQANSEILTNNPEGALEYCSQGLKSTNDKYEIGLYLNCNSIANAMMGNLKEARKALFASYNELNDESLFTINSSALNQLGAKL